MEVISDTIFFGLGAIEKGSREGRRVSRLISRETPYQQMDTKGGLEEEEGTRGRKEERGKKEE